MASRTNNADSLSAPDRAPKQTGPVTVGNLSFADDTREFEHQFSLIVQVGLKHSAVRLPGADHNY
jgi:hypothetical protein